MKRTTVFAVAVMVFALMSFGADEAGAIPAFARKHNLACSSCHSAWGYLNWTGRIYKEAGYILPDEDGEIDYDTNPTRKISDSLVLDKTFPISARLKGYVFDDKSGSDLKIRPLHEVEVFSAGNFWKRASWFFELEGEDEDNFETKVGGSFAWHFERTFNVQAGFGDILHSDPYNSLSDGGHRLTVAHKFPLDVGKATDSRFRKGAQYINLYGRSGKFFYMGGYSAGNGNPEGEDPQDVLVRAAFDFTPNLMIGALYFDGSRDSEGEVEEVVVLSTVDLSRFGIDFNLQFSDFYVLGLWMNVEEDMGGVTEDNDTAYIETFYTYKKDGRPFFMPLVRYDFTDVNDGVDTVAALTLQVGFFIKENARLALEYYTEIDQVPGKEEINRTTLLVDIAF
jgi:hypothetical protein